MILESKAGLRKPGKVVLTKTVEAMDRWVEFTNSAMIVGRPSPSLVL